MTNLVSDAQVNVYSSDPEALATFYKALGLTERFRFPTTGEPDQVELTVGSLTLGLTSSKAMDQLAGLTTQPGATGAELVLWCNDCAHLYARTLELGASAESAPKVFNARLVAAWIRDPQGNRVKLVSKVS